MKGKGIGKPCQHSAPKRFDARSAMKASAMQEKPRHAKRAASKNAWHNWLLQKYPF